MAVQEVEMRIKPVLDGPVVRPGDTLVVRIDLSHVSTRQQFDELVDRIVGQIEERLPGVKVVVVAADQLVIYRPDPEADNG